MTTNIRSTVLHSSTHSCPRLPHCTAPSSTVVATPQGIKKISETRTIKLGVLKADWLCHSHWYLVCSGAIIINIRRPRAQTCDAHPLLASIRIQYSKVSRQAKLMCITMKDDVMKIMFINGIAGTPPLHLILCSWLPIMRHKTKELQSAQLVELGVHVHTQIYTYTATSS